MNKVVERHHYHHQSALDQNGPDHTVHHHTVHHYRHVTHGNGGAQNPEATQQSLNDVVRGAAQGMTSTGEHKTPWIDQAMARFTDPNTIAQTSLEDKQKFMDARNAGEAAAKDASPADLASDLVYGNTNGPGQHDSRSMAFIKASGNAEKFAAGTPEQKESYLLQADFYMQGYDTYAHQNQPAQIPATGATA